MATKLNGAEWREALQSRLEHTYHWMREWVGDMDITPVLVIYALAGVMFLYALMG